MGRIVESGHGYVVSYYSTFLEEGNHAIIYAASRAWADKNAASARAFREAVVEAAGFMNQPRNLEKVRTHIGKYIKLPPEVLAKMQISPPGPTVSEKQMTFWVDLMKDQDMLKTQIDVRKLIVK